MLMVFTGIEIFCYHWLYGELKKKTKKERGSSEVKMYALTAVLTALLNKSACKCWQGEVQT